MNVTNNLEKEPKVEPKWNLPEPLLAVRFRAPGLGVWTVGQITPVFCPVRIALSGYKSKKKLVARP
jgi:hypothetical protein